MPKLKALQDIEAKGKGLKVIQAVKARLGMVPNFVRTLASSPAAVDGYNSLNLSLRTGLLSDKLRESIALNTAQFNNCEYSLASHTALGKMVGLSDEEILDSRRGVSADSRIDAALRFTHTYLTRRGHVGDKDLQTLRRAGYQDAEIVEIMANVALNLFTNYFNNTARPELDFPEAAALLRDTSNKEGVSS